MNHRGKEDAGCRFNSRVANSTSEPWDELADPLTRRARLAHHQLEPIGDLGDTQVEVTGAKQTARAASSCLTSAARDPSPTARSCRAAPQPV